MNSGRRVPQTVHILLGVLFLEVLPTVSLAQDTSTAPLWRQALGATVLGSPQASGETVALIGDDGMLKCYGSSGRRLWVFDAKAKLVPHLSRSRDGTSYICRRDGLLLAINRAGRELWRRALSSPVSGPLCVGWDERIFVPEENSLSCYTPAGFRLWNRILEAPINLGPFLDSTGGVCMVTRDAQLVRISPYGRMEQTRLSGQPTAIAKAGRYDGGKEPFFAVFYEDGKIEMHDAEGGTQGFPSLEGKALAAAGRGDSIAIFLEDGRLYLASLSVGDYIWSGMGPKGKEAKLIFDNHRIYIFTDTGAAAFSDEGRRLWIMGLRGTSGLPAFDGEGILYSGGADWILYAYRVENPIGYPEGRSDTVLKTYGRQEFASPIDDFLLQDETYRIALLQEITTDAARGEIGEDEQEYLSLLLKLAHSGSVSKSGVTSGNSSALLPHRVRALGLMGRFGSRDLVPDLVQLFLEDEDPLIKAATASAIGSIGLDPEGLAMGAFSATVSRAIQDERLLFSLVDAIASLCRFSGPPRSILGVHLLVDLSRAERPLVVRNRALEALGNL